MTESEWLTASNPRDMLIFLSGRVSDRKLRLFAFRCWDEQWGSNTPDQADAADRYAEGQMDGPTFAPLLKGGLPADLWSDPIQRMAKDASNHSAGKGSGLGCEEAYALHCQWLRDMFGNPVRPVVIEPSWLTSTVVALAQGIYADGAFDRLPILADALQDAGCEAEDVLGYLRAGRHHKSRYVRGDLIPDLLLGKGGWRASIGEPTMTEQEWSGCADPWSMLDTVAAEQPASALRRFACACCSRVPSLSPASRAAIDAVAARGGSGEITDRAARVRIAGEEIIAEEARFAEWDAEHTRQWEQMNHSPSQGTNMFYAGVQGLAERCARDSRVSGARAIIYLLNDDFVAAAAAAVDAVVAGSEEECWEEMVQPDPAFVAAKERRAQAALLREVIGNPFRPGLS